MDDDNLDVGVTVLILPISCVRWGALGCALGGGVVALALVGGVPMSIVGPFLPALIVAMLAAFNEAKKTCCIGET